MTVSRNLGAWLLVGALVSASAAYAEQSSGSTKTSFRWVDDKGVVHYGDRVPPEYAKKERIVLNTHGVEVSKLPAQRTPAQVIEDERVDELQRKQTQHDNFLLTTYQSVRDIEQLRDTRLQQLVDQRRSTQVYIDALDSRMSQLQERSQYFKPYSSIVGARPMPDQLAEDIVRTINEQRSQRKVFDAKRAEETAMRQQFQLDIDRYRQLRGTGSSSR